ncbi:substrate-binding domain-containing protein [Rhodoferax sp. GW822-FHT02A01]|uniref:substrate-binding domain-containing protein n=1 Tax=Rhodoferax sp. GW822-FHT02A01 TaxID=3141537 RepID=UPI00315DBF04
MKLGLKRGRTARLLFLAMAPAMVSLGFADEIHVASSGGFAAAYRALAPGFEARTGHKLVAVWGPSMGETSGAIPKRLERGEPIDVVIMVGDALDKLVQQGRVEDTSHRLLANSKIGVAVPAGSAKPNVSTVEGLKQALLNARSIAYSDSASGEYLSKVLFPRLGIADQIKGKSRMIPAEPVAQVVARGEADLGFQQVSELLPIPGIDFIGEIPEETQQLTPFSAGIVANSKEHAPAQALIDYLTSNEVAPTIRKTGLTPAASTAH